MRMNERLYRELYRIRAVEERVAEVYPTDCIKSPVHLSIGQESVSVGVCDVLEPTDVVFGTYRGHALYLAKGGDLHRMIAELYGKVTGCARGKGGSMHLIAPEAGMMGTSAVVGTGIPQAVGYAYALQVRRQRSVVAVFFGDGAVEEGAFHESMNFAVMRKLPVLFVCENNDYAIHTSLERRQPGTSIARRAAAYGMPAELIDDGDVHRIRACAETMVGEIRAGQGPRFLECRIYRWREHVGPGEDFRFGYRDRAEMAPWVGRDALVKLATELEPAVRERLESEVRAEIDAAFEAAAGAPEPEPSELFAHVFAEV